MARRTRYEEPANHERWLVSYADFITLLFAFFVVMYSVSSVNEGKFRVLADTMVASFKDPARSLEPIQVGQLVRSPSVAEPDTSATPVVIEMGAPGVLDGNAGVAVDAAVDPGDDATVEAPPASAQDTAEAAPGEDEDPDEAPAEEPVEEESQDDRAPMADIDSVAEQVQERMASLIDQDLVAVRRMDEWLEVEFNTSILFTSGAAILSTDAVGVLTEVAELLKSFPNPVQVEGFTDDVPISTRQFPSNWELSAARAASVVHLFTKAGIRPDRMVAIGYGEHRPIAGNDTTTGRRRNRRVVLVIPAADDTRRILDLERMSAGRDAAETGG